MDRKWKSYCNHAKVTNERWKQCSPCRPWQEKDDGNQPAACLLKVKGDVTTFFHFMALRLEVMTFIMNYHKFATILIDSSSFSSVESVYWGSPITVAAWVVVFESRRGRHLWSLCWWWKWLGSGVLRLLFWAWPANAEIALWQTPNTLVLVRHFVLAWVQLAAARGAWQMGTHQEETNGFLTIQGVSCNKNWDKKTQKFTKFSQRWNVGSCCFCWLHPSRASSWQSRCWISPADGDLSFCRPNSEGRRWSFCLSCRECFLTLHKLQMRLWQM